MNLQQLKLKLAHSSYRDVALLMGYNKVTAGKAAQRIANLLSDTYLGLYAGAFDFRYSDEQFLDKLCQVVGVKISNHELDAIHEHHNDRRDRYKAHVFADTNFKRVSEPIFALAFCESMRYLQLDYEVRIKPLHEQVVYVQALVKRHYIDCDGNLKIWGDIERYVFFYAEGCQLALNPDGVILGETESANIGTASLSVGNADITKHLVGENDS